MPTPSHPWTGLAAPPPPSRSTPKIGSLAACVLFALALPACEEPIEEPPHCGREDLGRAPPPREEPGIGTLVAVDFERVEASATLDLEQGDLRIESWATFVASEAVGRPVIQLMAEDAEVRLDGVVVALETVVVSEPPRTLRVLPEALTACSTHELEVVHTVRSVDVEPAPLPRLQFGEAGVWWSSAQEDGAPDDMLEIWLPSNLLFDQFELEVEVSVDGDEHDFVGNGDVVVEGPNRWTATFPRRQPHGSFWVLHPAGNVRRMGRPVGLPDGRTIEVELRAFEGDLGVDLEASADVAEAALRQYDERLGPYVHGGEYLAWLRTDMAVSMEYDGATLSSPGALEHEIAHSWWARGVAPVSDHHGWIDEGMAFWGTGTAPFSPSRVEAGVRGARLLAGEDDWSGAGLGLGDYVQGALVFSGLADQVGVEGLLDELRAFYGEHAPGPVSTQQLERWLYCGLERQYVLDVFHNKVYGLEGFAEPATADYCEGS